MADQSLLTQVPSEAWVGLFGVIFGSLLTTLGVWLSNRANARLQSQQLAHESKMLSLRTQKERLEELHVLISHWVIGLFGRYLNLSYVMDGRMNYNQYHDALSNLDLARNDYQRIEMIIAIYGHKFNDEYASIDQSRAKLAEIERLHKEAYLRGENGKQFLSAFTNAQIELESRCNLLKERIAEEARCA